MSEIISLKMGTKWPSLLYKGEDKNTGVMFYNVKIYATAGYIPYEID